MFVIYFIIIKHYITIYINVYQQKKKPNINNNGVGGAWC